jgi:ParB-like chromosome segregation protein Spo0J
VPVLVDTNLRVVAGHSRILTARKLGRPEIPISAGGEPLMVQVAAHLI